MASERILHKRLCEIEVMLNRSLQRKRALESEINHEFQELKKIEISLEIFEQERMTNHTKAVG
jgi:hypothetical protein